MADAIVAGRGDKTPDPKAPKEDKPVSKEPENPYKAKAGAKLTNHDAVRRDH